MFTRRSASYAVAVAILSMCWAGCASHRALLSRRAPYSVLTELHAENVLQKTLTAKNCLFGKPRKDSDWGFGPTDFVYREGYVLEHSATDRIPLWVCEGLTPTQLNGNASRKDAFAADTALKPGRRAEMRDYTKSGYDRGHMAPAGDQTVDANLKKETFFLSNMSPQIPEFNRQIWEALEVQVRHWALDNDSTFVITGGIFYDPKDDDPATADGTIEYYIIGKDAVAVPTHFFKIVIAKHNDGEWRSIAFVEENRKYKRPFDFSRYVVSIDWIEEHSGLDFMPDLSTAQETKLESTPSVMW